MSDRITIDPPVYHGKPCILCLRHPVENVLERLASRDHRRDSGTLVEIIRYEIIRKQSGTNHVFLY
jgi:hypothetical protein